MPLLMQGGSEEAPRFTFAVMRVIDGDDAMFGKLDDLEKMVAKIEGGLQDAASRGSVFSLP